MPNTRNLWVLAAAGVLLAGGFLLVSDSIFPKQSSIEFVADPPKADFPPPESSGEGEEPVAKIYVEIAGAVGESGVYQLPDGSRVVDLIERAGGFSQKADLEWTAKNLNQAAKLSDGVKIYIPFKGEGTVTAPSQGQTGIVSGSGTQSSGLININTASAAQLDSLPGIGPAYAQRIIDNRPYQNINNLLKVPGIGPKTLEKIKDKVMVE